MAGPFLHITFYGGTSLAGLYHLVHTIKGVESNFSCPLYVCMLVFCNEYPQSHIRSLGVNSDHGWRKAFLKNLYEECPGCQLCTGCV